MKKIPWKTIALICLVAAVLIVARSAVTVGKAIYFGQDWPAKLVADPWFYLGIAAAAVGIGALVALSFQNKNEQQDQ